MKAVRPASIRLFAALFFAQALCAYIDGLLNLDRQPRFLASLLPEMASDQDRVIVILSARLSIALIPIALIWFLRANLARWFVTLIALGGLASIPDAIVTLREGGSLSPLWVASAALKPVAVALLFTASARSWFSRRKGIDAATFE